MKYISLQLGRGLASILVMLHHTESKLAVAHPTAAPFLNGLFGFGWVGVDFFFVLSGFIIALTLNQKPTASHFLLRRLTRVHVPFWAAFALTLAVALAVPSIRHALAQFSFSEWGLALLLMPSGQSAPVIGVAWTLHHEILFYGVASLWLVRPALATAMGCALLLPPLFWQPVTFPAIFLFSPMHWEFVLGILGFHIHARIGRAAAWIAIAFGGSWIAAWSLLDPAANHTDDPARVIQHGIGFAFLCLGISALELRGGAWRGGILSSILQTISVQLGNWSYALYLTHIPIILGVVKIMNKLGTQTKLTSELTGVLAALVCLVLAWLFHEKLEAPLVRRCNRALSM